MKSLTYPLGLPEDLYADIQRTASETGLSMADAIRQSIKLGLPTLRERLSARPLKPFTKEECRKAFEVPDPEFDALAQHCAGLTINRANGWI